MCTVGPGYYGRPVIDQLGDRLGVLQDDLILANHCLSPEDWYEHSDLPFHCWCWLISQYLLIDILLINSCCTNNITINITRMGENLEKVHLRLLSHL